MTILLEREKGHEYYKHIVNRFSVLILFPNSFSSHFLFVYFVLFLFVLCIVLFGVHAKRNFDLFVYDFPIDDELAHGKIFKYLKITKHNIRYARAFFFRPIFVYDLYEIE